jgi:uncharacterized protein YoxC
MQIILYIILGAVALSVVIVVLVLQTIRKKIKEIKADISFLERESDEENWNNLFSTLENYQPRIIDGINGLRERSEQLEGSVAELKEELEDLKAQNTDEEE